MIQKLFKSNNAIFFISIALLINVIYFHFGLKAHGLSWDNFYKISWDSFDYIESCERSLSGREFSFQKTNEDTEFVSNFSDSGTFNKEVFYAFRSPGFAMIYIPIRLIFDKHIGLIIFILLQVFVTALAKYYLSRIGELLFKSSWNFYLSFLLINSAPFFTQYNNLLLTDSLGGSLLILSLYLFVRYTNVQYELNHKAGIALFSSGLLLTTAIMLRPFLAVFFVFQVFALLCIHYKNLKRAIVPVLLFASSFVIIDGLWIARNFYKTDKFIPLASTLKFQDHKHLAFFKMWEIAKHAGYSQYWWNPKSPVYWLVQESDERAVGDVLYKHSSLSFIAEIERIKLDFHQSLHISNPVEVRKALELDTRNRLVIIKSKFEQLNYFEFHFNSRINALWNLLNQPNMRFFHALKYPINVLAVFVQTLVTKSVIFIGFIALFYYFFTSIWRREAYIFSLTTSVLFLLFFFGMMSFYDESRTLYTLYGFLLLFMTDFVIKLYRKNIFSRLVLLIVIGLFSITAYQQMVSEIKW
jgi:hypothetical protein